VNRPIAVVLLSCVVASDVAAQDYWDRRRVPPRYRERATVVDNGRFTFGRIQYTSVRREALGQGWRTDYPDADVNFMRRLDELTAAPVNLDRHGFPDHVVVTLTSDEIFDYPFVFMSDVGTAGFDAEESARLRDYLLKGGFLYVDDFWGTYAWEQWEREMGRVLPEYTIFDLPADHPIFHTLYDVPFVPQIPSIQFWRRSGGRDVSERGEDSAEPHLRGIADERGRLMVVMSHNTDIADGWEREGEELEFFQRFSFDAYALGINIVMYALTH
jgi:hypothetical protein